VTGQSLSTSLLGWGPDILQRQRQGDDPYVRIGRTTPESNLVDNLARCPAEGHN
jgi:hypothetical protein